jgi:hypothetical protein
MCKEMSIERKAASALDSRLNKDDDCSSNIMTENKREEEPLLPPLEALRVVYQHPRAG